MDAKPDSGKIAIISEDIVQEFKCDYPIAGQDNGESIAKDSQGQQALSDSTVYEKTSTKTPTSEIKYDRNVVSNEGQDEKKTKDVGCGFMGCQPKSLIFCGNIKAFTALSSILMLLHMGFFT